MADASACKSLTSLVLVADTSVPGLRVARELDVVTASADARAKQKSNG